MSAQNPIRNIHNQIIGYMQEAVVETCNRGINYLGANGSIVGWYNRDKDWTKTIRGQMVGRGDCGRSLIQG